MKPRKWIFINIILTIILLLYVSVYDGQAQHYKNYCNFSDTCDLNFYDIPNNKWTIGIPEIQKFNYTFKKKVFSTNLDRINPSKDSLSFILAFILGDSIEKNAVSFAFQHIYQTPSNKMGGIIEYSIDTGNTWYNARDSSFLKYWDWGIEQFKLYEITDTLANGSPAFTGVPGEIRTTVFKLLINEDFPNIDSFLIRFSFINSEKDTFIGGWAINYISARVEGKIPLVNINESIAPQAKIKFYPNPTSGQLIIQLIHPQSDAILNIYNLKGECVFSKYYFSTENEINLNLSHLPPSEYFINLTSKENSITEKIIIVD